MTVETLHDALTYLPAELVAEADRRRQPRPALRWQRYAAIAACFVLIVCGGLLLIPRGQKGVERSQGTCQDNLLQSSERNEAPQEMSPSASDTSRPAAEGVPDLSQPTLTLTSGGEALTLSCRSFTWTVSAPDGTDSTLTVDVAAPTDIADALPQLPVQAEIVLAWSSAPDSISVRYWQTPQAEPQVLELTGDTLPTAEAGIYEITGQWPQGTASYAFRATEP